MIYCLWGVGCGSAILSQMMKTYEWQEVLGLESVKTKTLREYQKFRDEGEVCGCKWRV